MRFRLSKQTLHDSNRLVNVCFHDTEREATYEDEGVIVDDVLTVKKFCLALQCCPRKLVPVSDDVIAFIVLPRACDTIFGSDSYCWLYL